MAARIRSSLVSQCSACTRKWVEASWRPFEQQARFAHKRAVIPGQPPDTVVVQLRKPVAGYGPKGKYLAVSTGLMRNYLFRRKQARYLEKDQIQQLIKQHVSLSRDHAFAPKTPEDIKAEQEQQTAVEDLVEVKKLEVKTLPDEEALSLLEETLPEQFVFQRKSIPGTVDRRLYGSVTPADISVEMNSALNTLTKGGMVRLHETDVKILDLPLEERRAQHLGIYTVEISKPKADKAIQRKIVVEEESTAMQQQAEEPAKETSESSIIGQLLTPTREQRAEQ